MMAAMGANAERAAGERSFEQGLAELENIVRRLETGELPLEESLAAFEQGIALVRELNQKLTEVEKKVEVLLQDEEGKLCLRPLTEQSEQGK